MSPAESNATPSAGEVVAMSSEAAAKFWQEYLMQTRKEIDLEKTEITKLVNYKLLIVGGVFAIKSGVGALVAACIVPFLILAIDVLHAARFRYILHRWHYLNEHMIPVMRSLLSAESFRFFETSVVERDEKDLYWKVEAKGRAVFCGLCCAGASLASYFLACKSTTAPHLIEFVGPFAFLIVAIGFSCLKMEWRSAIPPKLPISRSVYQRWWLIAPCAIVLAALVVDVASGRNLANIVSSWI